MRCVILSRHAVLITLLLFLQPISIQAAKWRLTTTYTANDFFSNFDWFTDPDPTHGLVTYQSMADSQAANLSYVNNKNQFVMAVDTTPTIQSTGRNSVRITSKANYSDGVYVLNFTHVPTGCAVWPAFWTVTNQIDNWPVGGEIDIAENANDQYNGALTSLHTNSSCLMPSPGKLQSGLAVNSNCSAYVPGNPGCGSVMNGGKKPSWGTLLNAAGGGIYAMERSMGSTGKGVRVWFFPKTAIPRDLALGSSMINTSNWGKPAARFNVANTCHSQFGPHQIVFDVTLCGDFAGNTYNTVGCNAKYSSCQAQVLQFGSSFSEAYWSIGNLKVFSIGGGTDNAANSPNTH